MRYLRHPKGSITLIVVFTVTMVLFLFAFADYAAALKEQSSSRSDVQSEQSFYASQACLEEGYLQLRSNANYTGTTFTVGGTPCTVTAQHEGAATSGQLTSSGSMSNFNRTIEATYTGAGPATERKHAAIFHIIDKSGSMKDQGNHCTIPMYTTQAVCQLNGGVWGPQPITSTKEAAKAFIDRLDPVYDQIGALSFHEQVTLVSALSNQFINVKSAINSINAEDYYTNTSAAITAANTQLNSVPAGNTKVEILLTDGQANRPTDVATGEAAALTAANAAKESGIIIFTIGLGGSVNSEFLTNVASTINGTPQFYYAPSTEDLNSIYDRIAEVIIAYNLGQSSWHER